MEIEKPEQRPASDGPIVLAFQQVYEPQLDRFSFGMIDSREYQAA